MRRLLLAAPLVAVVVACSTDTGDFKDQTEDFLNDNDQVAEVVGGDVSDANCEEPTSKEVGTEYQCTAQVAGIGLVEFDVRINDEDSFLVEDFRPA